MKYPNDSKGCYYCYHTKSNDRDVTKLMGVWTTSMARLVYVLQMPIS